MADRREFPDPVKAEIRIRSGGQCEPFLMPADLRHLFPETCPRPGRDIDHIFADVLTDQEEKDAGPLTAADGALLCEIHHAIKTAEDQKARARRNRHTVRKDRPKSGWFSGKTKPIPSRKLESGQGFATNRNGRWKQKIGGGCERREA